MKYNRKGFFKYKTYAHFDDRKHFKNVKQYIYNEENIAKHSFYPFVLNTHKIEKFKKVKKLVDLKEKKYSISYIRRPKSRNILFSSHIDRYIHQLYNHKLNLKYNEYVKENGINKCSIAYRNIFKGKSSINFAHDVFKFILNTDNYYIFVGDFKNFFESLEHKYLKKMMCKILGRNNLPDDYYAIFKNITKYTYFDLQDICKIKQIKSSDLYKKNKNSINETGKNTYLLDKLMTIEEVKKYKSEYLHYNLEQGIPQGSAISSVLSNIYMIEADKKINNIVISNKGMYRRYSDDFIVIIPNITIEQFKDILNKIRIILKENGNHYLEKDKTKAYYFTNFTLTNMDKEVLNKEDLSKNELDYLGFTFNGDKIRIRDKSMSKFYYRMHRKIKTIAINHGKTKKGRKISKKSLYKLYSKLGKDSGKGNFITYNERCEKVFKDMPGRFISYKKRFMQKLKNRINKETIKYQYANSKIYYTNLKRKKQCTKYNI